MPQRLRPRVRRHRAGRVGARREFENEQLFLRFVDGQWQSVAEGTGISCDDEDKDAGACRRMPRPRVLELSLATDISVLGGIHLTDVGARVCGLLV